MKLKHKEFSKDGKGSATLIAEESEDLWHLYNLVAAGDTVKATTYRKVQRDDGTGAETKRLKLTIEVKKVEYDAAGDAIRFAGTVCEENEWVKMGAHHTIEIELNEVITLTKDCWDDIFRQQLEDATNIARTAEVAVVLMEAKENGVANISLLTTVLAKRVGHIEQALPKKRVTSTQLDKAMERFFRSAYDIVKAKVDLAIVQCVVLGGPGPTKSDFFKWMQTHAMQEGDSDIVHKKGIFVCVDTSSVHNQGLNEILADEQVQRRIKDTQSAKHFKQLQEFQKRLANTPEMCCYGPKEVRKAFEMGAIDCMMISDSLFRNSSVQVRKEYVELVSEVKNSGALALVFSSGHVTGQTLSQYGDLAANLRFQVEYEEQEEAEEEAAAAAAAAAAVPAAPAKAPAASSGGGAGAEEAGAAKAPEAGDTVEVLEEFNSSNKTPVPLPVGERGKVIKIDDVGDAYVDFGGTINKQWVKAKRLGMLKVVESAAAAAAKKAAAKPAVAKPAAAKPAAKPAAKGGAKKGKAGGAALQWDDDYDYW